MAGVQFINGIVMKNFLSVPWPACVTGILLGILLALWRLAVPEASLLVLAEDTYEWLLNGGGLPEIKVISCYFAGLPDGSVFVCLLIGLLAGGTAASLAEHKYCLQFLEEGSTFSDKVGRSLLWCGGGGFLLMLGSLVAGDLPWDQFALAMQMSRPAWSFIAGMVIAGVFLAVMIGGRIAAPGEDKSSGGKSKTEKKTGGRK